MTEGVAGDEVIDGMVEAGPLAMATPTPVTAPDVQCKATFLPPADTKVSAMSGAPLPRLVSSANGATGRSSGTLTSAMSEVLSVATTEAAWRVPPGPTMTIFCRPPRRSAVVATRPPSATATPISRKVPREVVASSSTMERPAGTAAAGTAFCGPARVVSDPLPAVSSVALWSGCSEAGESRTMTQATTAMTAPTPTRTMTALRYWWRGGGLSRKEAPGLGPGAAISLGWRHSRSSGSIQPCWGESGSSCPFLSPSPWPGVPSSGSSGVSLTWATIPRKSRRVPSADAPAVP